MGKGVLFMVAASIMAGSLLLHQSARSSFEADAVQSEQQAKVLAREIARSAYNAASATARDMNAQERQPEEIVDVLGTPDSPTIGKYQGGDYEYWAELVQGSTYRIGARGVYMDASYIINSARTMGGLLEVPDGDSGTCVDGCQVEVTYEQSQAGYCSAIYLQRLIPKNNNGHGNNLDSCDSSNPGDTPCYDTNPDVDDEKMLGNLQSRYYVMEPELVFKPDNRNRNNEPAVHETTLNPAEQMNFILAVDMSCDIKNSDPTYEPEYDDYRFDHHRYALEAGTKNFETLQEGTWAMTEQDPAVSTKWRIAFEDLEAYRFSDLQIEDIKANGYPDRDGDGHRDSNYYWDGQTYGGSGWTHGFDGDFIELYDYGDIPDFSDQVFYVELISASPPS